MRPSTPWWRTAVGYQIYLRSFADSDGDGLGDLAGLLDRLDHFVDLGVDLIWISPCHPSPDADHGYDVADYRDVDPRFGDLDLLDRVVTRAHEVGLRVIMDLVPSHTSDRHRWFRTALADPAAPEHDYYVWRDPAPDGGPPTNWRSHFGGPAWTYVPDLGRYYLHRFLPEQPDLNWRNPAVAAEFDQILTFWFERGIDGFRIDVAHGLLVDADFRDNPEPDVPVDDDADPRAAFQQIEHRYDLNQPEVPILYRPWRRIADTYGALLIGEVYLDDPFEVARYVADDALHAAFYFPTLHTAWDAAAIRPALTTGLAAGRDRFAWPLSSHDDPRAPTRFGGGPDGRERALAYAALLAALPGVPFLYQGDELALPDGVVDRGHLADPVSTRHHGAPGRDGARTPMPWRPGPNLGFSPGEPWLPPGANHTDADTVAAQRGDPASPLERTRTLLAVRKRMTGMLAADTVTWHDVGDDVLALTRGDVTVALSVGAPPTDVPLPSAGVLAHATGPGATVTDQTLHLPTDVCAWVHHR